MSDLRFEDDDVVFIGYGPLADAALAAVGDAGGIAIMLTTKEEWLESGRTWISPLPEHIIFDEGKVPLSQRRLEYLGEDVPGLRVFFAGEIPKQTTFRPPPIVAAYNAIRGEAPCALDRRGFEMMSEQFGFQPESLHEVAAPWDRNLWPVPRWDAGLARRIDELRKTSEAQLIAGRAAGLRPPPTEFDFVTRTTDSALAISYLRRDKTMLVRRWRVGKFDTAWLDTGLVQRYAHTGIERILVERNVILLGQAALRQCCDDLGISLELLDSSLEQ